MPNAPPAAPEIVPPPGLHLPPSPPYAEGGFNAFAPLQPSVGLGSLTEMATESDAAPQPAIKLAAFARDLRVQAPRGVCAPLGPIPAVAARAVDKCRAELVGRAGPYRYNCPLDRQFFGFAGLDAEALKARVATGGR